MNTCENTNNVISINPYKEGWKAFHAGKKWQDCPYANTVLSASLYQWMCGWDDASLKVPCDGLYANVHMSRK